MRPGHRFTALDGVDDAGELMGPVIAAPVQSDPGVPAMPVHAA